MDNPLSFPARRAAKAQTALADVARTAKPCRRCPIWKCGGQVVFGEGSGLASLMLVGEQPGDEEDRRGVPFVGPAGRVLDKVLVAAGIERDSIYVTNAVKHFKFIRAGKRRLHQRPSPAEIDICKWWLTQEMAIIKPKVVVALGASAARSLFGRPVVLGKFRDQVLALPDSDAKVLVTIHPSYVLRLKDKPDRDAALKGLTEDLERAATLAAA